MERYENMSRGELLRKLTGKNSGDCWEGVRSISEPLGTLMRCVSGAAKVQENWGNRIGDEYHATYFMSPEGVAVHFDAVVRVDIRFHGLDESLINQARERIYAVFKAPAKI